VAAQVQGKTSFCCLTSIMDSFRMKLTPWEIEQKCKETESL